MIRVSWVGMPTTKNAKETAEGWLARTPKNVKVIRKIDPSSDVRIAFGLDALGISGMNVFGRERFRKRTLLVIDDYLNAKAPRTMSRGIWFAKMVRSLLFVSLAEQSMFRRLYPDVKTGRGVLPIVMKPVKKHKRASKISKLHEMEPEVVEEPEPDPMIVYNKELDESAKKFWAMIIKLAR